jgi:hypothetical protein
MTIQSSYTLTADQLRQSTATRINGVTNTLQNGKTTADLTAGQAVKVSIDQSNISQINGFIGNITTSVTTLNGAVSQMNAIRSQYQNALDVAVAAQNVSLKQADRANASASMQSMLNTAQNVVDTYSDPQNNKILSGTVMGVASVANATTDLTALAADGNLTHAADAAAGLARINALAIAGGATLTAAQMAELTTLSQKAGITLPEFIAGAIKILPNTKNIDQSSFQPYIDNATKVWKIGQLLGAAVTAANGAQARAINNLIASIIDKPSVNTTPGNSSNVVSTANSVALAALLNPADIAALTAYGNTVAQAAGNNLTNAEIFLVLQQLPCFTAIATIGNTDFNAAGVLQDAGKDHINAYMINGVKAVVAGATVESVPIGFGATDVIRLNVPNVSNFANGLTGLDLTGTSDTDTSGAKAAVAALTQGIARIDQAIIAVKGQIQQFAGSAQTLNATLQTYTNEVSDALDTDPVGAFAEIKELQTLSKMASLLDYLNASLKQEDIVTAQQISQL